MEGGFYNGGLSTGDGNYWTVMYTDCSGTNGYYWTASRNNGVWSLSDPSQPFTCGTSTIQDTDGNTYDTTDVNGQCWMTENMRVGTVVNGAANQTNNGVVEKYCYDNNPANCATDGGLYQWDEAMQYGTTEGTQGICPANWHIPTDAEQYALENYLKNTGATCDADRSGGNDCDGAGTKMKSGTTPRLNFPLSGQRLINGSFYGRSTIGNMWSSLYNGGFAWNRLLSSFETRVYRNSYVVSAGFSVRCLQDVDTGTIDTQAPELTEFSINPATIDFSDGSNEKEIEFTLHLTDASGIKEASVWFTAVNPFDEAQNFHSTIALETSSGTPALNQPILTLVSGDDKNGVYKGIVPMHSSSTVGEWKVSGLIMKDTKNNLFWKTEPDFVHGFTTNEVASYFESKGFLSKFEVVRKQYQCETLPSGLDTCLLEKGDILLAVSNNNVTWGNYKLPRLLAGTYWWHAGIYLGGGKISQASGDFNGNDDDNEVHTVDIADPIWGYWSDGGLEDWTVVRPILDSDVKSRASMYAKEKADKGDNRIDPYDTRLPILYNGLFLDKNREDAFYCSQLPWKAYEKQGLNLEPDPLEFGFSPLTIAQDYQFVTGDDLYYSAAPSVGKSQVIAQKTASTAFRRVVFKVFSPVDLLLEDEFGRKTGYDSITHETLNEIPGTFYSGKDSEPEAIVVTDLKGKLKLYVVGNDDGQYTLEETDVFVDDPKSVFTTRETKPAQEDVYLVNGDENINLDLNVSIDIQPGSDQSCINSNNHGVVPVVVYGRENFKVKEIDLTTMNFDGLNIKQKSNGENQCSFGDINLDGFEDLTCQFYDDAEKFNPSENRATVRGTLNDGMKFTGSDRICLVPKKR